MKSNYLEIELGEKVSEKVSMLNHCYVTLQILHPTHLVPLKKPNCYMTALHVKYLVLPLQGFIYSATILRKGYSSIAYP